MTGAQAVVHAAILSGCEAFAFGPGEAVSLLAEALNLQEHSGQTRPIDGLRSTSDPRAASCAAEAASSGRRAMAVTSGAGLASCAEAVFLAQLAELPVVLLHVQHLGGLQDGARLPTDADVALAGYLTPLGSLLPVLIPCDAASTFRLTQAAFRTADDLRTPVVILTSVPVLLDESASASAAPSAEHVDAGCPSTRRDRDNSNRAGFCEAGAIGFGLDGHRAEHSSRRAIAPDGRPDSVLAAKGKSGCLQSAADESDSDCADRAVLNAAPPSAFEHRDAAGAGRPFQNVGPSSATEQSKPAGAGRPVLNVEPQAVTEQFDRLRSKIAAAQAELEFVAADADPDAHTLLVSYGLADDSARQAVAEVRRSGGRVSHLTLHSLWPLPRQAIRRAMTPFVRRVLVVEANAGLYAEHLQRIVSNAKIESFCGCDARSLAPESIARRITDWPCG